VIQVLHFSVERDNTFQGGPASFRWTEGLYLYTVECPPLPTHPMTASLPPEPNLGIDAHPQIRPHQAAHVTPTLPQE
jgi:hypothetical protein